MKIDLYNADCLEKMKEIDDNSVDAIVTDPPYGINFMGKYWDKGVPGVVFWKEMLRVLKPGGHLLSFGGTRTYHRMAVAIEDAGFEIRDMIEWVYGSGFPKSLNIGKAVDKSKPKNQNDISIAIQKSGLSITEIAKGCNVSPQLVRFWIDNKRTIQPKEIDKLNKLLELELEYTKDLREEVGINKNAMSGWNMDGTTNFKDRPILKGTSENSKQWEGWGTALKPAHEPICMARKPLEEKTVDQNVLKYGTGGINIDESRVDYKSEKDKKEGQSARPSKTSNANEYSLNHGKLEGMDRSDRADISGRFPANLIHDNSEEVKECFPNESERFFKSIIYQAKASKSERNKGCEGMEQQITSDGREKSIDNPFLRGETPRHNNHPTVKPIALMEYLIKMVTPKNGILLDPFMGSGTTGIACKNLNINFIGIELEKDFFVIAQNRMVDAMDKKT